MSPSKVFPLPPSYIFDEDDSEDGDDFQCSAFGSAHSPSELHIKYQPHDDEDDFEEEEYYSSAHGHAGHKNHDEYQHHPSEEMMQVPVALIADFRHMRFPNPPEQDPVLPLSWVLETPRALPQSQTPIYTPID